MVSWNHIPHDLIMNILEYLNYQDLFHRKKTIISKIIHNLTQKLLKIAKTENGISDNFLTLCWEKKDVENIPIILYSPNRLGNSLKSRLFKIFDTREPHQKLFVSNIFTNKLSFMMRLLENKIVFVEILDNKLNYSVYMRPKKRKLGGQILY